MTALQVPESVRVDFMSGFLGGKEAVKPLTYPVVQYHPSP